MQEEQAKVIIRAITGVEYGAHPKALDIAWELGNNLLVAVHTLNPDFELPEKVRA